MPEISNQQIEEALSVRFPGKVIEVDHLSDLLTVTISLDSIIPIIEFLYNDSQLAFKFLTTCCGMHFPDAPKKFSMVYHLHSLENNFRLRLKAFTNDDPPTFPTLTHIFKTANWMERETCDFFGFKFTGHPDLRRILNMDDLEGWPLRKEYPLEDPFRKDKDDAMFGR